MGVDAPAFKDWCCSTPKQLLWQTCGQDLEEVATESAAIQQEPTSIKPAILITLVKIHHFPVGGFKSFSTPRPPKGPMGQWVSCFARGLTGCLLAQF
jgi:hypothetical protein